MNKKPGNTFDNSDSVLNNNFNNNNHKNLVSHTVRTQNVNMQFLTQSNATGINFTNRILLK